MEDKTINLTLTDFEKEGLYLFLPDSTILELTRENIERVTQSFWQDPSRITPEIKKAVEFQKCFFCPHKNTEDICDSMRPILPFLDIVDRYVSFDKAIAVYRGKQSGLLHVQETTMQQALQYVSILSLLRYNLILRKYWKYYYGVIPLMNGQEVARTIYLNMYWLHRGNKEEMDKVIKQFSEELRISSDNQVKRLSLVCKNDAFMNAFVKTQIVTEFLKMNMENVLMKLFDDFEKST